ncbi:uncharacterized protein METZ01_LOCUS462674 [marine metagenome]|uniref:Uncharacterized protein n=1 Tax=marine metagenome TaxID=408172 RepID=A0A383AQM2_9ZZZZ
MAPKKISPLPIVGGLCLCLDLVERKMEFEPQVSLAIHKAIPLPSVMNTHTLSFIPRVGPIYKLEISPSMSRRSMC